jgi:hypothetical protein
MFVMTPARLYLTRAAFVVTCILPTLFVASWVYQHLSPRYWAAQQEDWQRVLSQRLGLKVEVATVAYPTIDLARLGKVRLSDPETGQEFARIRSMELSWTDEGWTVELSQPEIQLAQLPTVWKDLHERLFRQTEGKRCELIAGELTLHGEEGSQTLSEWQAVWEPGEQLSRLVTQGILAGSQSRAPILLTIARDRRSQPPVTTWELDTAGTSLPCLPAAGDLPLLTALGKDCKFRGQVQVALTERGWQGNLRGTLEPVDLDQLVTEHLPHKLSGQAKVSLDQCEFSDGRIKLLRGTLLSNGGYVSHSLLAAAAANLAMQEAGIRPASTQGHVYYQRMSFGFLLGEAGLTLTGQADAQQNGVMITAATSPILLEPAERQLPVSRLLHALATPGDEHALASAAVEQVRRILPLPLAAAPAGINARQVRIRESEGRGPAINEPDRERR